MNIVKPGTQDVVLTTPIIDIVVFTDAHTVKNRVKYGIVHKRRTPVYSEQFTDSDGHPISIVSQHVYEDVQTVLTNAMRRIQDLERDLDKVTTQRDSYKLTIDILKKNGVID